MMSMVLGEFSALRGVLEESVSIWRAIGSQYGLATALRNMCGAILPTRNGRRTYISAKRASGYGGALGSRWDLALALDNLGGTLRLLVTSQMHVCSMLRRSNSFGP